MNTYILIDAMNMFHRSKYVTAASLDMKVGMSLHIIFNAIRKSYQHLGGTHVVFCLDGRSWRKDYYDPYKKNRVVERLKKTQKEIEEDEVVLEAFNELSEFILNKTNATVLSCDCAEADDLIATWVDLHPDDNHIIVSSDSDFVQLISPNVKIYNGITGMTYTEEAVFDDDNNRRSFEMKTDGKIKVGDIDENFVAESGWQELALFVKCIRGDKSDNIFPAFPGARYKGTKYKTAILEGYLDKENGGYSWNNFMLQSWNDEWGNSQTVKDRYQTNRSLIDLRQQPPEYKEKFVQAILSEVEKPLIPMVGIHFLKFCGRWELVKISQYPDQFAEILNAPYKGVLKNEDK